MLHANDTDIRVDFPPILTLSDFVYLFHITHITQTALLSDPTFPVVEIGNQLFLLRDSLIDWLRVHERSSL